MEAGLDKPAKSMAVVVAQFELTITRSIHSLTLGGAAL